jgi:hypothetical protein
MLSTPNDIIAMIKAYIYLWLLKLSVTHLV